MGIHSKSLTPKVFVDSTATWIQPTTSTATRFWFLSSGVGYTSPGAPYIFNSANPSFSFTSDSNVGIGRIAADRLGLYAGTTTNPQIRLEGVGDSVVVDGNKNGTADLIVKSGAVRVPGTVEIGTYNTAPLTLLGRAGNNQVANVWLGDGLSLSGDTLNAEGAEVPFYHGYLGDGGINALDSISGSGGYDTLNVNYTNAANISVVYGIPAGSSFRAIQINKTGTYRITYHWTALSDLAGSNHRFRIRLIKNSTTLINSGRWHYNEEPDYEDWSAEHVAVLTEGDFLHFIVQNNTANKAVLNLHTATLTVQYIGPGPS